jgi:NhaP-type Na+/H+ or K+/H+ antiporter
MALAVFAILLFAYFLVAARLDRWSIGPALAFTVAGLVLGAAGLGIIDFPVESELLVTLAELTLALVLFSDAASLDMTGVGDDTAILTRLLGIGLLGTIVLGTVVAFLLFPGVPLAVAALTATILAPTDAALAAPIVTNREVPARVRRILNIESGMNDGIASPFVVLFTALAAAATIGDHWVVQAVGQTGIAVAVGAVVGTVGAGMLLAADRRHWTSEISRQVSFGALALVAFGASTALGGNGFIAAFVAGLGFRAIERGRLRGEANLTGGLSTLLSVVVWFLFGAVVVGSVLVAGVMPAAILYAVLSVSVIRMVPVALALVGSKLRLDTVLFIGWFGPRGLASIAFGLTAVVSLTEVGVDVAVLSQAVALTVLLSVIVHGLSAQGLARWFGRSAVAAGEMDTPEATE